MELCCPSSQRGYRDPKDSWHEEGGPRPPRLECIAREVGSRYSIVGLFDTYELIAGIEEMPEGEHCRVLDRHIARQLLWSLGQDYAGQRALRQVFRDLCSRDGVDADPPTEDQILDALAERLLSDRLRIVRRATCVAAPSPAPTSPSNEAPRPANLPPPLTDSRASLTDSRASLTDSRAPLASSSPSLTDSRPSPSDSRAQVANPPPPPTDSQEPAANPRPPPADPRDPPR